MRSRLKLCRVLCYFHLRKTIWRIARMLWMQQMTKRLLWAQASRWVLLSLSSTTLDVLFII